MTCPIAEIAHEVLALDEKATAGPWTATTRQGSWDWLVAAQDPIEICQMFHDGTELNETGEANSLFVALARTAAPALAREVLRQAWQPIETAPRDSGTWVILYDADATEPNIFIASFCEFEGDPEPGKWIDDNSIRIENPTHWMPIPDPPTPEEIERLKSGRE